MNMGNDGVANIRDFQITGVVAFTEASPFSNQLNYALLR